MPEEPLRKKILKNRMLIDYWLYLPRDELVEELVDLQAEIRGNQVQSLELRVNEAYYCSKPSEANWMILSFTTPLAH